MKNITIAFLITCVVLVISAGILKLYSGDFQVLIPMLGIILSTFLPIHQALEKYRPNIIVVNKNKTQLFDGFAYSSMLMLLYITVLLVAIEGFIIFLTSILGLNLDVRRTVHIDSTGSTMALGILIGLSFSFFLGRWVGIKSSDNGVLIIIIALIIEKLLLFIFKYPVLFDGTALLGLLVSTMLLGFWRGRATKKNAYISYLLGKVPTDNRDGVLRLVQKEVEKLGRKTLPNQSSSMQ